MSINQIKYKLNTNKNKETNTEKKILNLLCSYTALFHGIHFPQKINK